MGRANDQLMFLLQIGYLGKSAHAFDFTVTSPRFTCSSEIAAVGCMHSWSNDAKCAEHGLGVVSFPDAMFIA